MVGLGLLIWLVVCFSCTPLERPGISLVPGLRINSYIDLAETARQLDTLGGLGFRHWALEWEVVRDSATQLPKISRTSLTQFSRLLPLFRARNLTYEVVCSTPERDSLRIQRPADPVQVDTFFTELALEYRQAVQRFADYPPTHWTLGQDLEALEPHHAAWHKVLRQVRAVCPGVPLGYSVHIERIETLGFSTALDFIGLTYRPRPLADTKTYGQAWHPIVVRHCQAWGKPSRITAANILERPRVLTLKNRLRFWPQGNAPQAVILNTVYPFPALTDTLTPYGLGSDAALQDYLKAYLKPVADR
jgi:hypothetical protein